MVGVRYAMTRSDRLLSLLLTDTGSNTLVEIPDYREFTEKEKKERKKTQEIRALRPFNISSALFEKLVMISPTSIMESIIPQV